jgi:hypothetical protein
VRILSRWGAALGAAALTAGACAAVIATYGVYSQTWDEPLHMVAGLEWLERGTYGWEPLHPPLARVLIGIGPWLAGARLDADPNPWVQGNRILGAGDQYTRMLSLARAGVLPFLALAAAGVFFAGRRAAGTGGGLLALLLFVTIPPVLAHAGLATTDLALAAGTVLTFVAFLRWREEPTPARAIALGLTLGGTILTKFSSLLFLPVALAAAAIVPAGRAFPPSRSQRIRAIRPVWITAAAAIWLGYRLDVGPALPPKADGGDRGTITAITELPIYPAPALVQGLAAYAGQSAGGRKAFFLGERGREGWWLFFPTLLVLKSPIPLLVLTAAGAGMLIARRRDPMRRTGLAATVAAAGILLVLLPSRVNIGLRHALAVYPFLAVVAAYGASELWQRGRHRLGAVAVGALLTWQVVGTIRAAPDFLPWFNALAGPAPERIVVDSDLDWGQDLKRMADTLHARGITNPLLAYNGSTDPAAVGIERYRILRPFNPDTGWIAISVFTRTLGYWNEPTSDDFAWLEQYEPVTRAGPSMLLYRVETVPGSKR